MQQHRERVGFVRPDPPCRLHVGREFAVRTEARGADAEVVDHRKPEPIPRRVPVRCFERRDGDPLYEHRVVTEHRGAADAPPAPPRGRDKRSKAAIVEEREPTAERGESAAPLGDFDDTTTTSLVLHS